MKDKETIVFLHLSDIHIDKEKDISDEHIRKIVDSLKSYKSIKIKNIIIILSGDITYSGNALQFSNAKKLMGSLIVSLNKVFKCSCTVLVVPGNHDVNHADSTLSVTCLKEEKYSEYETGEYSKLNSFYNFARLNHCFERSEMYFDIRRLTISNCKIKVNLINNGIFSTLDQYKGLLYLPIDCIDKLSDREDADFVITIMHHAPDFYRDDIKNQIEDTIVKNSDILFHGHEHYNYSKQTSFNGSDCTVIQSGGCLCNNGDWDDSSYIIGLLDTESLKYEYYKYTWNGSAKQYEHDSGKEVQVKPHKPELKITEDFLEFIHDENEEKHYVFPSIIYHGNKSTDDYLIETASFFEEELQKHRYSIIVGAGNVGKTTLLKNLFSSFAKSHYVLYASPEKLLEKSKHKRQNIDKLIKALFEDIYGVSESEWQAFEQSDAADCIFMLDDFEQIYGINISDFFKSLSGRFGTIIITNTRIIDFDTSIINIDEKETIAKFEIKAPVGHKRREIIRAVVLDKADDKSEQNVESIVKQVDHIIKTQLNIIPPEPYYIIQMAENFMNHVGEAIYKSTNAFSKVFEANLTNKIDEALKTNTKNRNITVDLMYVIFRKLAYYIHFNKAYPVKRCEIERVIKEYNDEYGNNLETEDIISIAKAAKIIADTEKSREEYRFRNKSILAYFVAKEIVARKDVAGLEDVINKACINICTDILLFIIYLTDETSILSQIMSSINRTVVEDTSWEEFSIPDNVPMFIKNSNQLSVNTKSINKKKEKKQIEKSEETVEESMVKEFRIRDIYDWDDAIIDEHNNKLFRMMSLLQIIAKSLPCFEHLLKKDEKNELIRLLYTLPNRIFMFWCNFIEKHYEDIIKELKTHPYFTTKKPQMRESDIDLKVKSSFALYSMNLLLNLYYIPVLNAAGKNTVQFLNSIDFFDYRVNPTYQLEHLMFLEQIQDSNEFVSSALTLQKDSNDKVASYLLQSIVRHGLITRNDTRENIDRLESKFFPKAKKPLLIERAKDKYSKK